MRKLHMRSWNHLLNTNALLIALALAAPAKATECVDPDDGDCHETIQEAIDDASSGERIEIAPGVYSEALVVDRKGVHLIGMGEGWGDVIIDPGADDETQDGPGIRVERDGVKLEKLTVRNALGDGIAIDEGADEVSLDAVAVLHARGNCVHARGDELAVDASHFEGCLQSGIRLGDGPRTPKSNSGIDVIEGLHVDTPIIRDSHFVGLARDGVDGRAEDSVIENCHFDRIDGEAIHVSGEDGTFAANEIRRTGDMGIYWIGDGFEVTENQLWNIADTCIKWHGRDTKVEGNHLEVCGGDGIDNQQALDDDPERSVPNGDAKIVGNTVRYAQTDCIETQLTPDALVKDNLVEYCGNDGLQIEGDPSRGGSPRLRVIDNVVRNTGNQGIESIGVEGEVIGNTVVNVLDNSGIEHKGRDSVVRDNYVENVIGDGGIDVTGADCEVLDNYVTRTAGEGIEYRCGLGLGSSELVDTQPCDDGLVRGNVVTHVVNDNGYFIRANDDPGDDPVVVEDNYAAYTGDDGFYVKGFGVVLRDNHAEHNGDGQSFLGDNGFLILGWDMKLEGNRANDNVDDGFHICGRGHHLEGNHAWGNREDGFDLAIENPPACVADVCDSGPSKGRGCISDADCQGSGICEEEFDGVFLCNDGPLEDVPCSDDLDCLVCPAEDITLEGNRAEDNLAVGFEVSLGSTGIELEDNEAEDNRTDFCDEGAGTDEDDNDFDTTGPCVID